MADTPVSGTGGRNPLEVQVLFRAPKTGSAPSGALGGSNPSLSFGMSGREVDCARRYGRMAERFIASVLKTETPKGVGGSNPSPSANTDINPDEMSGYLSGFIEN
jgi:hypothetical protein